MRYLPIGKIIKPFGIKGGLKAVFFVDDPDEIRQYKSLFVINPKNRSDYTPIHFDSVVFRQGLFTLEIKGVTDRDQAELLRNVEVFIEEDSLPKLKKGSYYIKDLISLEVLYQDKRFGFIDNFIEISGKILLQIKLNDGKTLIVPFTNRYFPEVNLDDKQVVADSLEELL